MGGGAHRFQFLNFRKVPLQHQLLAANGATVLDSTFLSWSRPFPPPPPFSAGSPHLRQANLYLLDKEGQVHRQEFEAEELVDQALAIGTTAPLMPSCEGARAHCSVGKYLAGVLQGKESRRLAGLSSSIHTASACSRVTFAPLAAVHRAMYFRGASFFAQWRT